jgi:integrase
MKPWDKQKALKESKERVATIEQIVSMGLGIEDNRIRTLFFLIYLTGGRICELVRKRKYNIIKEEIINEKKVRTYARVCDEEGLPINEPSLRRKDITFSIRNGRHIMLLFLRNEKNRKKHTKEIPVPLDRAETVTIYNSIKDYISGLEMEDELFPFGYQFAYRKLKEFFNPHWLRHLRATHLTVNYDLSEADLKIYMGWTDSRPASIYTEMRWQDLLKKL